MKMTFKRIDILKCVICQDDAMWMGITIERCSTCNHETRHTSPSEIFAIKD